jgi:branched-subunit amino acid ABC-type transport system permease component
VVDFGVLYAQALSGLTNASFLFLMASGLSLIFGVMRVLNFAHGSLYMVGAYAAYQFVVWFGPGEIGFWGAVALSAAIVAVLGGVIERFLFRLLYAREELYQLLFTYALVLFFTDLVKVIWGVKQHSVSRPPSLSGSSMAFGATLPDYNLFVILLGPLIALVLWLVLQRTRAGRLIRAAALDREMLETLGVNVNLLYLGTFVVGSFLAGLAGALITPVAAIVPGMDAEIIIALFIIVVIGGLGSFWGTFLGAVIYGLVFSFGILLMPRFSLFAVGALMVAVLILRPTGLLGGRTLR